MLYHLFLKKHESDVLIWLNSVSWNLTSRDYAENPMWTITLYKSRPQHQTSSLDFCQMISNESVPLIPSNLQEITYREVGLSLIFPLVLRQYEVLAYVKEKEINTFSPDLLKQQPFLEFWKGQVAPINENKMNLLKGESFRSKRRISRRFIQRFFHFEALVVAMSGQVGTGNINDKGDWFTSPWDNRLSEFEKYLQKAGIYSTNYQAYKPEMGLLRIYDVARQFDASEYW